MSNLIVGSVYFFQQYDINTTFCKRIIYNNLTTQLTQNRRKKQVNNHRVFYNCIPKDILVFPYQRYLILLYKPRESIIMIKYYNRTFENNFKMIILREFIYFSFPEHVSFTETLRTLRGTLGLRFKKTLF